MLEERCALGVAINLETGMLVAAGVARGESVIKC
jgi:hypothetical protein